MPTTPSLWQPLTLEQIRPEHLLQRRRARLYRLSGAFKDACR